MNKIICLALAILMLFGGLVACGNVNPEVTDPTMTNIITIPAITEAPTEPILNADTEYIIAQDDNVSFIIKGAPYDDRIWGTAIDVYLENNTNKNLMFTIDEVSINGYMVNPLFATTVAAGKKENTSITIFADDMTKNNVTRIENIEFTLHIYNADDLLEADILEETYSVNFMAVG